MLAHNQGENIQFDQSMGHTVTCKTKNTDHKSLDFSHLSNEGNEKILPLQ